ncbi:MAG: acyl carrier protein [Candidatus Nealsonbacteria bacterium]|nr:acyl carrier protein [Candidatus Nealsonbacteria bacterium]
MSINRSPSDATALSRDRILAEIKEIVAEQTETPAEEIREDHHLLDDLGFDSLAIVEMSMEIEEHFDVSVPDELGEQARTVRDVTDGVLELLGQAGRTGEL